MKHTTLINNVKSHEWGLTLAEAHVFSWIIDLPIWAEKIFIEGEVYYFASKTKAVEDLPLITDKVDTMYRHYKSLEVKGVIVLKKIDGKDYISYTKKSKGWVYESESDTRKNFRTNSEINPKTLGKKSDILNHYITKSTIDIQDDEKKNFSSKIDGSFTEDPKYVEKLKFNIQQIKTYDTWKGGVCKKHSIQNLEDLDRWIDMYESHVLTQSKSDISINELRRHFDNWLGTRIKAGAKLPIPKEEHKPWKVNLSNMQFH